MKKLYIILVTLLFIGCNKKTSEYETTIMKLERTIDDLEFKGAETAGDLPETGKKKHLNASDCYRSVYNVGETTKPSSIWTEASKLLSNPKVSQRIDVLKGQMETHALSSSLSERDKIIERLWVMADNGQAEASQLRSLELLGKSIGLFSDRVEISETKNLDQVERELVEKLSALKQTVDKK